MGCPLFLFQLQSLAAYTCLRGREGGWGKGMVGGEGRAADQACRADLSVRKPAMRAGTASSIRLAAVPKMDATACRRRRRQS